MVAGRNRPRCGRACAKEALMGQTVEDPIISEEHPAESQDLPGTRRDVLVRGAMLSAAAITVPFATACARAEEQSSEPDRQADKPAGPSLYDRLGGIFALAAVVNYFSDEI